MFRWVKDKFSATPRAVAESANPAPQVDAALSERLRSNGNSALDRGDLSGAARLYRQACEADPRNAKAFLNLGFALAESADAPGSEQALLQAVSLDPWLHDAHYMLGMLNISRGQVDEGVARYRQALAVKPDFPDCRRELCIVLAQAGNTAEARAVLEGGNAFEPGSLDLHFFSGNLYLVDNQFQQAIEQFGAVVQLDPANAAALANLGLAQFKLGDVFSAIDSYERVLALQPANVLTLCNLGGAQQISGRLDLAAQSYARALDIDRDYAPAHHNRLYALSFDARCAPLDYLREARISGAWMSERARPYSQWLCDTTPGSKRPLRVGIVSGDLRNHAVGAFLEGVVRHVDKSRLTLFAYSTRPRGDQLTDRIKPFFSQWSVVNAMSDDALAARIHADRIDILVDLAGHTAHNRLPMFAWRPAPVQVAWLGFFATTGVAEIDYIMVDPVCVPDEGRQYLSEQPWFLPDTRLCFTEPVTGRPLPVAEPPAVRNGYVTFGSFQIFSKLSDDAVATWAKVLSAIPDARLRLQSWQLGFAGARDDILQRLERFGVSAARVTLEGGSPRDDYLEAHGQVDIILDTFPFPGGTTTAEALWMGVPTVTLTGRSMLERQGESLLRCAGLGDWVATTEQQFVDIAVEKAADLAGLARLRARLREQVLASPLFDAGRFARHLEGAFEDMWRAYCAKDAGTEK